MANNGSMSLALATAEKSAAITSGHRRQNGRLKVDSNAVVTVFGEDFPFDGMLVNLSESGALLSLDRSVDLSALLKIECTDFFLLGEVVACEAERGDWVVRVSVEHGVYGLRALAEAIRKSWL
jgi:hypothetical protein